MVRRIFPSFHYENDLSRANTVRNSWVTQDRSVAGFVDAAEWEEVKEDGDDAIEEWIDEQMKNTSVTVVMIGKDTHERKWVNREIEKSVEKGKGLLGIHIHNIKDLNGNYGTKGPNPFSSYRITTDGAEMPLTQKYDTYDWVNDDGYNNLGDWVEDAATNAGR
ncbi:TIR domain-containing protein [Halomarina oriensis]|uniref:TIR domain-containing protein n=1 Tax=Halomarina oriensis TaxID=671145 RepID=A0A6B0GQU5_9EURY|nr:TIR domain-containing protein [Halomarina oriensis]MWG34038.1 TIR domain-containing protein [Halomarina oriensis]